MEQNKIWEHFQNNDLEAFNGNSPRLEYLFKKMRSLAISAEDTVLNIGVGNGSFETMALARGFKVAALDPDSKAIEKLKKLGIDGRQGFLTDLPFESETFRFVVASEVLEHLRPEDMPKAIQEIRRVLKKDGIFLGSVPFNELLKDNEAICPNCTRLFHRWGHQQSFSKEKLETVISSGLTISTVKVRSFVNFRGRTLKGKVKSVFKWILGALGEQVADPHLYFCARKK